MKAGVKSILFLFVCANLPLILIGQQHQDTDMIALSGVLLSSDSLKPIQNAEVFSGENTAGVFTDSRGNFTIAVMLGDTLLFSSLGYSDMTVEVNDSLLSLRTPIQFYMPLDTIKMHEVVIHAHWSYRMFKQKIIEMKMQTHPFDVSQALRQNPLLYRKANTGISAGGPIQMLYDIFNAKAVLKRKLIHNRKAYNRHMIKIGRPQDTIPTILDYMREKQH